MKTHALPLFILFSSTVMLHAQTYPIVSTGQSNCFDTVAVIAPPLPGQPFYGQDAQQPGTAPSYTANNDGLTAHDNVTGLTWQSSSDTNGDGQVSVLDKLTFTGAVDRPAALNARNYGGYSDWRLPSIKELYSLIIFNGMEPSPMSGPNTRVRYRNDEARARKVTFHGRCVEDVAAVDCRREGMQPAMDTPSPTSR